MMTISEMIADLAKVVSGHDVVHFEVQTHYKEAKVSIEVFSCGKFFTHAVREYEYAKVSGHFHDWLSELDVKAAA